MTWVCVATAGTLSEDPFPQKSCPLDDDASECLLLSVQPGHPVSHHALFLESLTINELPYTMGLPHELAHFVSSLVFKAHWCYGLPATG